MFKNLLHHAMLLAAILSCLAATETALAHHDDDEDESSGRSAETLPQAVALPALDGPTPWSDKPVLNDPNRFHIAIMTDRTGGHRPGIWMKGVRRLNLLRPEFVVSVGDLIEGYTTDRDRLEQEWAEFLGFIDQLEMKFFFVAGNHDLTNPVMHELWRKKFGPEWYSFDYKDVHFVCLCSEDPVDKLGEKQLAWLNEDLEENRDARWTLVFLHKPLWVYAERALAAGNEDKTNWKQVEAMLGSRPHTVFAGHVHHYVQYERNGMKYYHLATTGGGSGLRGVPYGEFDHVTWLTMEDDGPHIAHLLLDGILPPDAVTEKGIARFRSFLSKSAIEIAPILVDSEDGLSKGRIDMRLTNGFDQTIEMSGVIDGLPLRGLTVDPEVLVLKAEAGETAELAVNIEFSEPIEFPHLAQTVLTAKLRTVGEDPPLTAERTLPVVIDRRFDCPTPAETVVVDGELGEWGDLPFATSDNSLVLDGSQNWTGVNDASVKFAVTSDDQFLYLGAHVTDERLSAKGDAFEVWLDARPIQQRKSDGRLRRGTYTFRVPAPTSDAKPDLSVRGTIDRELRDEIEHAAKVSSSGGYDVELAVPVGVLAAAQGEDWQNFQLTVVVEDKDGAADAASRVVWRGTDAVDERNTNYAHFVRATR